MYTLAVWDNLHYNTLSISLTIITISNPYSWRQALDIDPLLTRDSVTIYIEHFDLSPKMNFNVKYASVCAQKPTQKFLQQMFIYQFIS